MESFTSKGRQNGSEGRMPATHAAISLSTAEESQGNGTPNVQRQTMRGAGSLLAGA